MLRILSKFAGIKFFNMANQRINKLKVMLAEQNKTGKWIVEQFR